MNIDFQAIKDTVDLLAIAGEYTTLNKSLQGPCPVCHQAVKDGFYIHKGGKRWGCRKCQPKGGDVLDLVSLCENITKVEAARRLTGDTFVTSRPLPAPAAPKDQPRSIPDQDAAAKIIEQSIEQLPGSPGLDYAASRGLSPETLARYRIGFVPQWFDPAAKIKRPALVIPWLDADGTVQAVKFRFTDTAGDLRYTALKGSSPLIFGANVLPAAPRVAVVVEGELNALAVSEALGTDALVLSPGSQGNTAGLSAAADLISSRYSGVPVVLWFDEEQRVKDASKTFRGKAKLLKSPGGMDANDILREYGSDVLRDLILELIQSLDAAPAPSPTPDPIELLRALVVAITTPADYADAVRQIEDAYDDHRDEPTRAILKDLLKQAERRYSGHSGHPAA